MSVRTARGARTATIELNLWACAHAVLLILLDVAVTLGPPGWLCGGAYALVVRVLLGRGLRRSPTGSPGAANRVTLFRSSLVGCATALVASEVSTGGPAGAHPAVLVTVASVALALDAVDGHLARRTGTVSPLGARFDMEVDAFLILVLCVHLVPSVGAWVLAIGALRYVFAVLGLLVPWLRNPLPPRFTRKAVAALQGIVLVVAVSGLLPPPVNAVLAGLSLAALGWSFVRDIAWLVRNR